MGYYISLQAADFVIPFTQGPEALRKLGPLYRDVYGKDPADLEQVFRELAWPLKRGKTTWRMDRGPAVKQGWEQALFDEVAPFVNDGSFVDGLGEDGEDRAWFFSNGECNLGYEELQIGAVSLSVPAPNVAPATRAVVARFTRSLSLRKDETLADAFVELGWNTGRTADDGLALLGKRRPHLAQVEERLFRTIARYVTPGSFVEGTNQNDESWRWVFDASQCRRVYD